MFTVIVDSSPEGKQRCETQTYTRQRPRPCLHAAEQMNVTFGASWSVHTAVDEMLHFSKLSRQCNTRISASNKTFSLLKNSSAETPSWMNDPSLAIRLGLQKAKSPIRIPSALDRQCARPLIIRLMMDYQGITQPRLLDERRRCAYAPNARPIC